MQSRFDGAFVTVPFGGDNVERTARDEYRTLLDEHDSEDVLVLMGAPTSSDTFRETLGEKLSGAASERLYCCLYEFEDTALEERAQASGFLTAAYDDLPWVTEADDPGITSERASW